MLYRIAWLSVLVLLLVVCAVAQADIRPFTFAYDTYPMGKGNVEYEQWVTWEADTDEEAGFENYSFRHEFEFGLADNFDLGIYVANWHYIDSEAEDGTDYDSSSIEAIYYMTNPVEDRFGSALYAEIGIGEEELEFEQKLLLQKNIEEWVLVYNLVFETELEHVFDSDEETEVEGVLEHVFGVSHPLTRDIRIGGELIVATEFEDWDEREHTTVYAGPNINITSEGPLWLTVTPTVQLTDEEEEPNFMVRMIAGWQF